MEPLFSEYVRDIIRKEFQRWLTGKAKTVFFRNKSIGYNAAGTEETLLLEVSKEEGFLEVVRCNFNHGSEVGIKVYVDGENFFDWGDWKSLAPETVQREDILGTRERIAPYPVTSDHWDATALYYVVQYIPQWPGDYFSRHLKITVLNRSTTTAYLLRGGYIKYRLLPK